MTGRCLAALTAFATALLLGLSTGIQLYYRAAIVLALVLVYALLSVLGVFFTFSAHLSSKGNQAVRGERIRLLLTARHTGLLPPGKIRLSLQIMNTLRTENLSALPLKATQKTISLPCPHRGVYTAQALECEITDLFGIFCLSKSLKGVCVPITVQPRMRDMDTVMPTSASDDGGSVVRTTDDTASPADVRAWKSGDALKRIHWKLSARRQELTVRTYEESIRPDTLIVPDLSKAPVMGERALAMEDAVCETALSLAKAHLLNGFPVRMPLMNRDPVELSGSDERDLPRFVSCLTHTAFDSESPYPQALSLLMRRTQRTGEMLLVTARLDAGVAEAASRLGSFGVSVTVFTVDSPDNDTWSAYLLRGGIETVKIALS